MLQSNSDFKVTGISKSALRWLAAGMSLVLFTAIIGLSYSVGVGDAQKGAIPIIRSDGKAIKVRPENPGGRQYPHQDLVIYNSFRNDITQKETYLKDTPEKPMVFVSPEKKSPTDALSINKSDSAPQQTEETFDNNQMKLVTVSDENVNTPETLILDSKNKTKTEESTIKQIITQSDEKTAKSEPIKEKEIVSLEKQKVTTSEPTSEKGSYLQIGSFRSETEALAGFKNAHKKFSFLSNAGHLIAKVNLGAKGTYYRLKVGPFTNKQMALDMCNKLKAKGQPCLYIVQ